MTDNTQSQKTCPECRAVSSAKDWQNLILHKSNKVLVVIEARPYNAGQISIFPRSHKSELSSLEGETKDELFGLVSPCLKALEKACGPEGFNVGFNQSDKNPGHFKIQVVPRWPGDANFLATIGGVKAISSDLIELADKLRKALKELEV